MKNSLLFILAVVKMISLFSHTICLTMLVSYTEEVVCITYLGNVRKSYADQTVLVVHLAMNKTVMSYQMCSYQGIILTALKASKNMTSALQVIL